MRTSAVPFQFEISEVLTKARSIAAKHVANVTLNLPFISIPVNPKDREKQIAREVVIRLRNRRVLSARECCDDCIDRALKSLQEIRVFLVEKEVELSDFHDGPLFLLVDMMAIGIRQFLTFEQRLRRVPEGLRCAVEYRDQRLREAHQRYFDGLEVLRDHLSHCLGQVAVMADITVAANGVIENYRGDWNLEHYKPPALPKPESPPNEAKAAE
jgi:hypothetical protein